MIKISDEYSKYPYAKAALIKKEKVETQPNAPQPRKAIKSQPSKKKNLSNIDV